MSDYNDDREVTYEIVEEIGIISSQATGWTKELNIVAWNGGQGKYDIREWSPQHDRMSRGITLNEQEMRMILDLLRRRERRVPRGRTRPSQEREEFVPRREPVRETGNETVSAAAPAEANADLAASPQATAEAPVPEGMTRTDEESWEGPVPEAKPETETESESE